MFEAQLDQEAALRSHNSGIKAQRIKCCVTLRKRNCVDHTRMCAAVRACVSAHAHMHLCGGVYSVSVYMCQFEVATLMAVVPLQQDENKRVRVCKSQARGDTEREGEHARE